MVLSSPVVMETDQEEDAEEMLLHERLVEYIRALGEHSSQRSRMGVWMEHSYARAEGCGAGGEAAGGGGAVRVLLPPPAPAPVPPAGDIDVCDVTPAPQPPAGLAEPDWVSLEDIDDNEEAADTDGEWENQVSSAGRAGEALLEALAPLRLAAAVLRGAPRLRPHVIRASQRMRAVLCSALTRGEIGAAGAALRGLLAAAPPAPRRLAAAAAARLGPGLRARVGLPPIIKPTTPLPPVRPRQSTPVLVFISLNSHETDRWRKALRILLPLKFVTPTKPAATSPPQYAAELLAQTQELLSQQLQELGDTPSIVCGFEAGCLVAGAALAGALAGAGGASVKGLLALAPPLYTAEGEATLGARLRLPILAVVGEASPTGGRAAAGAAAAGGAALVLVGGAGAGLRGAGAGEGEGLQPALDRAIAEEVFTWAREITDPSYSSDTGTAEEEEAPDDRGSNSGRSLKIDDMSSLSSSELLRLPVLLAPAPASAPATTPASAPAPAPTIIDNATIVWSEPPSPAAPPTAASLAQRGGSNLRYTRVIVAKRPVSAVNSSAPVSAPTPTNKPLFVRRIPPRQLR